MELTGVGSGIMIAIAALLWLVYLVPSWLRRREFDATERNAVRLQQTLRIMAETAEVPRTVRAETTARSVLEQERLMKIERRRREDALRAIARAATPAQKLRRARATFSLILLVAVAGLVASIVAIVAAAGALAWVGLGASVLIGMSAIGMLGRLAPRRAVPVAAAPQARRVVLPSARATATPVPATVREWTPVPIPKPLYLQSSSSLPEPVEGRPSNLDIARAQLARAAAESEAALRAAQQQATPITASGRFAAMGRLDEADLASTDIDAVLARRRA